MTSMTKETVKIQLFRIRYENHKPRKIPAGTMVISAELYRKAQQRVRQNPGQQYGGIMQVSPDGKTIFLANNNPSNGVTYGSMVSLKPNKYTQHINWEQSDFMCFEKIY